MQDDSCPRCSGSVYREQDQYGPRLVCYTGDWQVDLLAPPPETLEMTVEVENLNRRDWGQAHNVAGVKQSSQKYKPHGGKRWDWWGGTRKPPAEIPGPPTGLEGGKNA